MWRHYCLILFNFVCLFSYNYQSSKNGNDLSYFVGASSLKNLSNSVGSFRKEVTESKDVELFNIESEHFVNILNKINFQSFEIGRIFVSEKDFNDLSKSYLGMKQGILGLKNKLEKRNALTKEESKNLDYFIHSLDEFSLQFNKTIEILQISTVVLPVYPINFLPNFFDALVQIKTAFLNAATLPFWHILGLKDVGSMLSDSSNLANEVCTSDKEANLNILCWINEIDIINLSRINTENLLYFFNKTALLNILMKQDTMKMPLNKSELLNLVASDKNNLRNPELFQFIKSPFNTTSEFINHLKNSSYNFGLLSGSHELTKFFSGGELLKNLLINPEIKLGNNLNFLFKPNLMNFLNTENVINRDEMEDDLLLAKFGLSYKLVVDFGNTLKSLNKHIQGEAEIDLVLNDLKSLSSILKVFNGLFRHKNDESFVDSNNSIDFSEKKKFNTSSKTFVAPLFIVDGVKYKINPLNESIYMKDQFSNKIPTILYDYLNDIISLEKAIEMNKNINYSNQIQEKVPKNLEKQIKAIVLRGSELVQVFSLETLKQVEVPFIKEITGASAEKLATSDTEYETLNKLLNFETSRINTLKNLIYELENTASPIMSQNVSHSIASITEKSSENVSDLFDKIKHLEFTSEHLINAKILLDCFSRDKLDLLLNKVFSASSITMPVIDMSKSIKNNKNIYLNSNLPTQTFAVEENFFNFIAFVKKFKDSNTLDIFMQKFIMLNSLVPNTFISHFNKSDINTTKDIFNYDASSEKSMNMMKPFTLLFLPEIKQKFQNSISSLITSSSKVTKSSLSNAILCTKRLIDMLAGIKLLTPISNRNHYVDIGLKSTSDLLYIFKNNITADFEISFDLIEIVTAKMDISLSITNPLTLMDLPAFNLKMAARNFMDDLNALKQHFLIISKPSDSLRSNRLENLAKNTISKGLIFLNAMKTFMTILVFLFVKVPISIKLFLCELLLKSIDMPNPIGISKEIFSNVALNSASEKLPFFEDAAIRSRNLLTNIATKYFSLNKVVNQDFPLPTSISNMNVIPDTLMAPFTFFNKSFNENLLFNFINHGIFKQEAVGITNNTIVNTINETHADVEKVSKILTSDEIISGSSTNLLYGSSSSLLRLLDIHSIKRDHNGKSLLHHLDFPSVQLPKFSRKLIQF